jgi:hypothetical protein
MPAGGYGGQELDRQAMMAALPSGVEVALCNPDNFDAECDGYIVCSVLFASHEQYALLTRQPHVVWPRDLWILPRNMSDKYYLFAPLCASAALCLFPSPLFRDEFLQRNVGQAVRPGREPKIHHDLAMSALDPEPFLKMQGRGKREGTLWTGDFNNPLRGLRTAIEWCMKKNERLDVLGYGGEPPPFILAGKYSQHVNLLDPVPYEDMPQVYADHERFILLPSIIDPCGRAHMEAALAGLEVVADKKMSGVMSYDWWGDVDRLAEELRAAPARFWERVLPIFKRGG